MTPTVHRKGPYSFRFFSADRGEPPHIHVKRDKEGAKFWLDPVELEWNRGFPGHELRKIQRLVEENREMLLREWHDYFGT